MINLGLLGKNISHSKSAEIYKNLIPNQKINYQLFDVQNEQEIPELGELFSGLDGLSITSPYKKIFLQKIISDKISSVIGAVNCIKKVGNDYLGTNTDYYAVEQILKKIVDENDKINVKILGDGVMSRLTEVALKKLDCSYQIYSRKTVSNLSSIDFTQEKEVKSSKLLIINSCSRSFVFAGKLDSNSIFWDFNYSFSPHDYLNEKVDYRDGFEMLKLQAMLAINFWKLKV